MATSTQSFEEVFVARLEDLLKHRYPALKLEPPASGFSFGVPRPDFVISNPTTGSLLICELKSDFQARHIPLSTLSYIRGLRDWYLANRGNDGTVIFITTGEIPQLVKKGLTRDGIPFFEVVSPEEAIERLDVELRTLQQAA